MNRSLAFIQHVHAVQHQNAVSCLLYGLGVVLRAMTFAGLSVDYARRLRANRVV